MCDRFTRMYTWRELVALYRLIPGNMRANRVRTLAAWCLGALVEQIINPPPKAKADQLDEHRRKRQKWRAGAARGLC